ncbi:hypothetical protein [Caulobacter sp. SSI4214]|uniref:hypothetical protein n=1 Tax=Caulobacter sp. SSI4214 TaxID=2575739 RepID=UPI0019D67547|nr:hypothetical protein [Caulobacter sp. SSI4214]
MSADPDLMLSAAWQSAPWTARWRRRSIRLLAAVALHLLPFTLLVLALPQAPKPIGGSFGQSVSVTLVAGAPASAAATPRPQQDLASLQQRLSDFGPTVASEPTTTPSSTTRLSDLFGPADAKPAQGGGANAPAPSQSVGSDDDPFARASVSYRGDDPAKALRLQAKAQRCAQGSKSARLLVIINSEGYLVARPRPLGPSAGSDKVAKTIAAVERCAPFADAATPGPPRSYEINVG